MPVKRRQVLKDTTIQSARKAERLPAKGDRKTLWDVEPPGFGVRIDHNGQVSYIVVRRFMGKVLRVTLRHAGNGEVMRYPDTRLAEARERARDVLRIMRDGINPLQDRLSKRQAEARALDAEKDRVALTAERSIDDYLATKKARRSFGQIEAHLLHVKKAWAARPLPEITEDHVIEYLAPFVEAKKLTAYDRRLANLKAFFKWAKTEARPRRCSSNPTEGLKLHKIKSTTTRDLKEAEIRAAWEAAEAVGYPVGPFTKLLLLTGCRLREVAQMRWSEISESERLWELPPERSKTKAAFVVPLSDLAWEVVSGLPRVEGQDYVLASSRLSGTAIAGFGHFKDRIDKICSIPGWTWHDLRRTARTQWSKIGIDRDIRERLMNHVVGGVEEIYDRYDFLPQKKQALQAWANRLREILSGDAAANVVRLPTRSA